MRLIEVDTLQLKQFNETDLPQYGILSHTWEGEEVDYLDFTRASLQEKRSGGRYYKIQGCVRLAEQDGLEYVWIDTCCIDKSSSAELQEAINSMYRWYEKASVCYVYLRDHPRGSLNLTHCRWVTRCWTLQELIAPSEVLFYAEDWSFIGSKREKSFECNRATGIDYDILAQPERLTEVSVARKMSWASKRQCTRVEDQAYSLMGLFGINMPMLYGEGERAFMRLQEEIVKTTFDLSLFAWTKPAADASLYCGLLSPSPAYFESCTDIVFEDSFESEQPYSVTNLGMQLPAELIPEDAEPGLYLLRLVKTGRKPTKWWDPSLRDELAVRLKRLSPGSNHFARVDAHELFLWRRSILKSKVVQIYIRQFPIIEKSHQTSRPDRMHLDEITLLFANESHGGSQKCAILHVWPQSDWIGNERNLLIKQSKEPTRAAIWYSDNANPTYKDTRVILLEFRPTGERRISVCYNEAHYFPPNTKEADMDTKIMEMFECTDSEIDADGNFHCEEDDGSVRLNIHANIKAYILNNRVLLEARVGESRDWY